MGAKKKKPGLDESVDSMQSLLSSANSVEFDQHEEEAKGDTKQDFKNLYWTRMISLQTWDPEGFKRWPMKEDIKEAMENLADFDAYADEEWKP